MLTTFYLRINNPYLSTGLIICQRKIGLLVARVVIFGIKSKSQEIDEDFKWLFVQVAHFKVFFLPISKQMSKLYYSNVYKVSLLSPAASFRL